MSLTEPENCLLRGAKDARGEAKTYAEMRLHPRLHANVAMSYQMSLLESEVSWSGDGTLKDISFGGVYFTSNDSLPLQPGQIRNFVINTGAPDDRLQQVSSLRARCLVMRVQRPAPDNAALGIAVKFLTPLQLGPA